MASTIKVNNIQNQCGANIINESANTITIGASGDTIQLAAGASQTGFGRTGTVDWDTTAKTASFTAVSGNGYFVNTTSGAVTVTLPAGSAGDIVAVSDYASTAQTNNIIIAPNGTDKINGVNASYYISTQGLAVTLVYADATKGWKSVTGSDADATGAVPAFVTATGGTITCCGDYKIHTFTGPGTFTVTCAGNAAGSNSVDYLVVAGGGSGGDAGDRGAGGGGAGGFREGYNPGSYTASPLATTALPVTASPYPVTVGAGGAASATPNQGCNGSNSIFSIITSTGGGGAGGEPDGVTPTLINGLPGGSGGGGGSYSGPAGTGNTPPVSPAQGQNGGPGGGPSSPTNTGGGGGGAGAAGVAGICAVAGNGGNGATTSISGTPTAYGGGGGGAGGCGSTAGTGGTGGGGNGGSRPAPNATAGTANTGGGGGGDSNNNGGAAGGSGIVIIRYKFQ